MTLRKAWLMLAVVFFLSVVTPMLWFSIPPLHNNIAGLVVQGKFKMPAYYDVFADNVAAQAKFGMLMSILSMAALIAAVPSAPLVKRFGVKVVLILGSVCILLGALVSALSGNSFRTLLAARIVTGLGVGFVAVASPTAISLWFPDRSRAFAMAVWSTWVPVGMLIIFNGAVPLMNVFAGDLHSVWWAILALAAVALVLVLAVYRNPRGNETTEVSSESVPFRRTWPFLKQRQLIALAIAWLAFNYVNYCFTTYNVDFFQAGFGMNRTAANLWGSIASACGIIAPLFGAISDRIERNRKYLMIVFGMIFLTLAGALGFKTGGTVLFGVYLMFQVLGNAILVATCRPMVPLLVGKGGVTAVSFGLSVITFLQYAGQMFTGPFFGGAADRFGWAAASWFAIVPIGLAGTVASLFIKPGNAELSTIALSPPGT